MPNGPCLCGDPHCSSCGNPAAAEFADALENAADTIENECDSTEALAVFMAAGIAATRAFRAAIKGYTPNDIVGELQREIADLKYKADPDVEVWEFPESTPWDN
jgi:hypothetical protein